MEELILQLLKENGRVILPEFGALIVKTKSPFKVIFNEFLQYNDGALISATAKKENIEREDAARKVKEFIAKIISDLDHGKQINLGEIGVLSKSSTGKISLGDAGEVIKPKVEAEIKQEATKDAVEFDLSEPKKTTPEIKKTPEPTKKEPVKATAPETKKEKTTNIKKEEKPKPKPKQHVTKEPMPIEEYYEEDNSKKRLNYILWGILIVIVNGAIVGYFLFDDEIKSIFAKNKTEQTQAIETPAITNSVTTEAESPAEEELVIEDDTEEIIPVVESNEIIGKKYYVVAGVFKDETNADNLVIKLSNQGYNAEKFGKIGALHAVSYDVFPTKKEADQFMLKLKKEVDSETWIRVVE